jgi:hypothetical protein
MLCRHSVHARAVNAVTFEGRHCKRCCHSMQRTRVIVQHDALPAAILQDEWRMCYCHGMLVTTTQCVAYMVYMRMHYLQASSQTACMLQTVQHSS